MKLFINIIITQLAFYIGIAQQDAQYTQYMYNTGIINPAYVGSSKNSTITIINRQQWLGVNGAPVSQSASFDSKIGQKERLGIGFSMFNDKIAPTTETNLNIDFSYSIKLANQQKLNFGLKLGGSLLNVDLKNLSREDQNDIAFYNNIENRFLPNVGLGIYYYTNNFYIGISSPAILETSFFNNQKNINSNTTRLLTEQRINYYLITGHTFDFNRYVKFKPAILTKIISGAPLQIDLSSNFLFYQKFTVGIAYRVSAAFSCIVGFNLFKKMMIGFSFDYETSELANTNFNKGSYELLLRYDLTSLFKQNVSKMITPRFF